MSFFAIFGLEHIYAVYTSGNRRNLLSSIQLQTRGRQNCCCLLVQFEMVVGLWLYDLAHCINSLGFFASNVNT